MSGTPRRSFAGNVAPRCGGVDQPTHAGVVQTFLPYDDFERSTRALDVKRLGKQRVETIQVVAERQGL
jgi:hypothetical protein